MQKYTKLEFTEMVCDFTKDENGVWWFLNMRAFKVTDPYQRPRLKPFTGWADENSEDKKDKTDLATKQQIGKNLKP